MNSTSAYGLQAREFARIRHLRGRTPDLPPSGGLIRRGGWPNERLGARYPLYTATSVDGDHGRVETRQTWACGEIEWFAERAKWPGLRAIIAERRQRELDTGASSEWSYYITDLPAEQVQTLATTIREHWSVENHLHWVLDMVFHEDPSRSRRDHAAENLAVVSRLCLALIKKDTSNKNSLNCRRKKAGWNRDYLLRLMSLPAE